MTYILVVVGAVNSASRLASYLEKNNIKNVKIIRTPVALSPGGCSYSVKINENDLDFIRNIYHTRKYKIKKIYRVSENDSESEYNDIS